MADIHKTDTSSHQGHCRVYHWSFWSSNKRQKKSPDTMTKTPLEENDDSAQVPCQLVSMFQIQDEEQLYCVIHSCHFKSKQLSVLSSMWMKEYHDVPESRFDKYKNMQLASLVAGRKPIYCIVEAESIVKHCLLIPYCGSSCFFLLIRDPIEWSDEFYTMP